MISKSMTCDEPFLLQPAYKDYLWGGSRLQRDFGKCNAPTPLAEAWECSTHRDGYSVIASGTFKGRTLADMLRERPQLLGTKYAHLGALPILIKLIDAKRDLSVQVHPDDDYAMTHEQGERGKTEMWYVLEADSSASLVYGFNHDMSKERLQQSLLHGTVERYLQRLPARANDVYYIPAGLVHALGAGLVVAEIQESSDLTYRLYDYDRKDKNGHKRPLHITKALAVAKRQKSSRPRQPVRILRYAPGSARELLCCCQYFVVERLLVNTTLGTGSACITASSESFLVLLCIEGGGELLFAGGVLAFAKGSCIFVPAGMQGLRLQGKMMLLLVHC